MSPVYCQWVVMDSNHRSDYAADLQSAPFGHSGNYPKSDCKSNTLFRHTQPLQQEKTIVFCQYAVNRCQTAPKFAILIAVYAPSTPLLPSEPPARSSAC